MGDINNESPGIAKKSAPQSVDQKHRLVLWAVLSTFLSLIPTAYAAVISNSIILFADFLRCLAEFIAIFISWLVLRKVRQADLSEYNYGFGKLEQAASVVVATTLFGSFLIAGFCSIDRFLMPQQLHNTLFGFLFAVASVAGNMFLWLKNYSFYRRAPSPVMNAQWRLFRAKTMATLVVAVSLAGSYLFHTSKWSLYLDPAGSFLLAIFLLYSAYTVFSSALPDLVDRAVEEGIQIIVLRSLIRHEAGYQGLEKIRSRHTGHRMHIEIFLSFYGNRDFRDICAAMSLIESDLSRQLAGAEVVLVPLLYEGDSL